MSAIQQRITQIEQRIEASYCLSVLTLTATGLASVGFFMLVNFLIHGETL